jgi:hypothetical protein
LPLPILHVSNFNIIIFAILFAFNNSHHRLKTLFALDARINI